MGFFFIGKAGFLCHGGLSIKAAKGQALFILTVFSVFETLKPLKIKGLSGRGGQIRTDDFLLPKQALYQAELRPERGGDSLRIFIGWQDNFYA